MMLLVPRSKNVTDLVPRVVIAPVVLPQLLDAYDEVLTGEVAQGSDIGRQIRRGLLVFAFDEVNGFTAYTLLV